MAIYELPAPDPKLVAEAERLCAFLSKQCRPDGSVHYTEGANDDSAKVDPAGTERVSGRGAARDRDEQPLQPAAWKIEAANKGLAYYRAKFKSSPHPLLAATLSPVAAELYRQTKSNDAAVAIFEMNDWLCGLQITATDQRIPQWAGGFRSIADGKLRDDPPGAEVGLYVQSLALCV